MEAVSFGQHSSVELKTNILIKSGLLDHLFVSMGEAVIRNFSAITATTPFFVCYCCLRLAHSGYNPHPHQHIHLTKY